MRTTTGRGALLVGLGVTPMIMAAATLAPATTFTVCAAIAATATVACIALTGPAMTDELVARIRTQRKTNRMNRANRPPNQTLMSRSGETVSTTDDLGRFL